MSIKSVSNLNPVTVLATTRVGEAAKLMREHHIGSLVAVEPVPGGLRPVGMITDRDLALEILPLNLNPERVCVEDIMMRHPVTVTENTGIFEAILIMKRHGIRRLPVVDEQGLLRGLVAADDLARLLSTELGALTDITERQIAHEKGAGAIAARYL